MTAPIIPDLANIPVGMTDWVRKVKTAITLLQNQIPQLRSAGLVNQVAMPYSWIGPGGLPRVILAMNSTWVGGLSPTPGPEFQFYDASGVLSGVVGRADGKGLMLWAGDGGQSDYAALYNSIVLGPNGPGATTGYLMISSGDNTGVGLISLTNGSWYLQDAAGNTINCTSGAINLNASGNIQLQSGNWISMSGVRVDLAASQTNLYCAYNTTASNAANVYMNPASGMILRSTSSRRYKAKIRNAPDMGGVLDALQPVIFKDKREDTEEGQRAKDYVGFIAEDLADIPGGKVFVEYVEDEQGNRTPESIQYSQLVVPLVQAYQKQKQQIADLTTQVADLTARLERLEAV